MKQFSKLKALQAHERAKAELEQLSKIAHYELSVLHHSPLSLLGDKQEWLSQCTQSIFGLVLLLKKTSFDSSFINFIAHVANHTIYKLYCFFHRLNGISKQDKLKSMEEKILSKHMKQDCLTIWRTKADTSSFLCFFVCLF